MAALQRYPMDLEARVALVSAQAGRITAVLNAAVATIVAECPSDLPLSEWRAMLALCFAPAREFMDRGVWLRMQYAIHGNGETRYVRGSDAACSELMRELGVSGSELQLSPLSEPE